VGTKGFTDTAMTFNESGSMEKKCPVCKKTYTTFDGKKKYCSDQCARKANKK